MTIFHALLNEYLATQDIIKTISCTYDELKILHKKEAINNEKNREVQKQNMQLKQAIRNIDVLLIASDKILN